MSSINNNEIKLNMVCMHVLTVTATDMDVFSCNS